jgi:hypothetical protein
MRTQIKKYLTICLLAFAFTMEAATKNFLKNQEKMSASTQTVNKATSTKNKKLMLKSRLRSAGDTLAPQPSKDSIAFVAAASATVDRTKKQPIENSKQPSKPPGSNHSRVKPHLNRQKSLLMTTAAQLSATETKVPDEIVQDAEKDHIIQGKSEDLPKVITEKKSEDPKDITEEKFEDLPRVLTEEKSEDLNKVLKEEKTGAGDEVDIIETESEDLPKDITGTDSEDLPKDITGTDSEDLPKIIKEEKSEDLPKNLPEEKSEDLPKLLKEEKSEDLNKVLKEEKTRAVEEANIIGTEPAKLTKDIIGTEPENTNEAEYKGVTIRKSVANKISKHRRDLV